MNITLRRLGEHRGAPRLFVDSLVLRRLGFVPGAKFDVRFDAASMHLRIELACEGNRKVSKRLRNGTEVPVIDINSQKELGAFTGHSHVRVVLLAGVLHVLALASVLKASERACRLASRLSLGQPLRVASVAFGAGVSSSAIHDGLTSAGVSSELVLANEINEEYLQLAARNNSTVTAGTALIDAPMQEAVSDDWLLRRVGRVEILEAGVPCSGASKAGTSKRKLTMPEAHPVVGHLIASVIQWIAALQPSVFWLENVVSYRDSASATILRGWLRDAGYEISEVVLDARDFGSLEARVRWFLIAHPQGMLLDLEQLATSPFDSPILSDVLDDVSADSPSFRPVQYLKDKALRDESDGKGFSMQLLEPTAMSVPTLRKGYHKGGSTDPRVLHPVRKDLSRLLTAAEHARIKGIDPQLIEGASETVAHQVCGQSVDTRPVRALASRVGAALTAASTAGELCARRTVVKPAAQVFVG